MLKAMCATIRNVAEDWKWNVAVGKRMRELRKAAGLTQSEVAARMGCTQKDVSRWEAGRAIAVNNLYLFCKAVGGHLADFEDLLNDSAN